MGKTHKIHLGNVEIGGGAPVVVQSMTNTDTRNSELTLEQIKSLAFRGCEIVRVAVPDEIALRELPKIVSLSPLPLIADIHFDWKLAVGSIEAGMAGIRINPGNIGSRDKVEHIIDAARANGCVIRIGVNSGSIQKNILARYKHPTPHAMVESALEYLLFFEKCGFYDIKFSLKSSSVLDTISAYRLMREKCDYPLHIGVTEAGSLVRGAVKSSVGLGILLGEGIGDTIRVSLTDDPEKEVMVAWEILRALGLRHFGPEIISCPTCGRTEIDLFSLVAAVENMLSTCDQPIKVAVMGCPVNGPGEAREADIGIAGGKNRGIIFKKGQIIHSVTGYKEMLEVFSEELQVLLKDK